MKTFVIFGASSGLGLGLTEGMPSPGDHVWMISRNEPASLNRKDDVDRRWLPCDLASPKSLQHALDQIDSEVIDMVVYCAGTWESNLDIGSVSAEEVYHIIAVNLSAFIKSAASLALKLKTSERGWIVAIGSTAGLENATGPRAAYAASKFGLRGAIHSLREVFRGSNVGTVCLSPGGIASDVSFDSGTDAALNEHSCQRIPISDFIEILHLLFRISKATVIKEIDMPAANDGGA